MSQLLVLTFNDTMQADEALDALKKLKTSGKAQIDDAAVVVKDQSGSIKVKNQLNTGVKIGLVGVGLVGLLLAGVFFPLAGLAIGAVAGGLIGKMADIGLDQKFVKEVTETLKPNMSALFVIGSGEPYAVLAALEAFQGTIYQMTLSAEAVEILHSALKQDTSSGGFSNEIPR